MYKISCFATLSCLLSIACGHGDDPLQGNENEVITTVTLTFTPLGNGDPTIVVFDDPDGDGGAPPTVDAIELVTGDYIATLRFENRLESPPEDITEEVADESQEHQIFFTGVAIDGPASDNPGAPLAHTYSDQDANGLPIGLDNSIVARAGAGDLVLTLRHLPPIAGVDVKTSALASEVREGGFSAIGGTTDAQVSFSVLVQ